MAYAPRAALGLVVRHLKASWIPAALVGASLATVIGLVGQEKQLVLLVGLAAAIGASTRPSVFRAVRQVELPRAEQLSAAVVAGWILLLICLGPSVALVGLTTGLAVCGYAAYLQTVYLASGCFLERGATWLAIAITALTVFFLAVAVTFWVGFRDSTAIGASPQSWSDLAFSWGLTIAVPAVALGVAWLKLGALPTTAPKLE